MAFTGGHVLRGSSGEDALANWKQLQHKEDQDVVRRMAGWYQTMDTVEYLRKHQKTGSKPMSMESLHRSICQPSEFWSRRRHLMMMMMMIPVIVCL